MSAMIKETTEEILAHNIKNIFVDVTRVRNVAHSFEIFNFGHNEAKRLDFPKDTRIAIFVSLDDHAHDFIETVFKNAGYACHIFREKSSAIEWLNE